MSRIALILLSVALIAGFGATASAAHVETSCEPVWIPDRWVRGPCGWELVPGYYEQPVVIVHPRPSFHIDIGSHHARPAPARHRGCRDDHHVVVPPRRRHHGHDDRHHRHGPWHHR